MRDRSDRERLTSDGYTILRGVLNSDVLDLARAEASRLWVTEAGSSRGYVQIFDLFQFLPFLDLVDQPVVVDLIRSVLGDNIGVYHSHLTGTAGGGPVGAEHFSYKWHQDAKALMADLVPGGVSPCMSLKAGFFLSDVPSPEHGATVVIPGSHSTLSREADVDPVPVLGRAGDCVVFDNRLWHSRGPNTSSETRLSAFVGYSFRWVQNRDRWGVASDLPAGLTSTQKFLLGAGDEPRDRHVQASFPEVR